MLFAGPFYAAAALLVLAGGQKVVDPAPLVRAARSVGFRLRSPLVRTVAGAEVALGVAALTTGAVWTAAGIAVSYAAFTGFVLLALSKGGVLASCGCFGKADVPPTRTHAIVTAGFAAVAVTGAPGSLQLELPLLVATAAVAACAYLVLTSLPLLARR